MDRGAWQVKAHVVARVGYDSAIKGFPGGASGKKPAYQCRRYKRCRFESWVGKIPWRRKWHPTPGFLPGESQGQRSLTLQSIGSHRVRHD